jgi:hypothetical protein
MNNPFNALLYDPGQLGQGITNAFMMGMDRRKQMETERALGQYASNQSPETAANVSRYDPRLGIQLQDREQERQRQIDEAKAAAYKQNLQARAAQGDKGALAELAGIDFNAWDKLADNDKAMIAKRVEFVGNAALAVSQLPQEQQPAAWDQYARYGAQMFPELADQVGKYSPEALQGAMAAAGQVKTFLDMEKPSYMAIPEGGTLVNTRDPQAVAQFGAAPPQAAPTDPAVPQIIQRATATRQITPEEAQVVQSQLGPNGQAAFAGWMQQNGIHIAKTVNGQTYYQVNGKWYDNPEGR